MLLGLQWTTNGNQNNSVAKILPLAYVFSIHVQIEECKISCILNKITICLHTTLVNCLE